MVAALKETVGHTPDEVAARGDQHSNPLRTNARATRMPWTKVDEEGSNGLEGHIRRFCTMLAA